jgi:hypothetical protein
MTHSLGLVMKMIIGIAYINCKMKPVLGLLKIPTFTHVPAPNLLVLILIGVLEKMYLPWMLNI